MATITTSIPQRFDAVTVGDSMSNFPVANYPTFSHAVNAALGGLNGRNIVMIQGGQYTIPANGSVAITPVSGVRIMGYGQGATIIKSARRDYIFKNSSTSPVNDFWIEDMTIDCQNLPEVNAMALHRATRSGCRRVEFKNSDQWFVRLGNEPSNTTEERNIDCEFTDCTFDSHSSIYEALLIYNSNNTRITRCKFYNNSANSPVLGVYQKTTNTKVESCDFWDCAGKGIYYGITCHDTFIRDCTFYNCATAVQGGNVPDHGNFGETHVQNVTIEGCRFKGGANSRTAAAIQFGAVDGCYARDNIIEGYERGIVFTQGNPTVGINAEYPSINGIIQGNTFKNINPNNNLHAIHGAIVFNHGAGSGLQFMNNKVLDNQGVKTLRHAVCFNTAGATYSNIIFTNNDLGVDTSNSGTSVKVDDSATLAASVRLGGAENFNFTS